MNSDTTLAKYTTGNFRFAIPSHFNIAQDVCTKWAVNGGQFPRKYGVGKQSDAVIRDSQLTALNFL